MSLGLIWMYGRTKKKCLRYFGHSIASFSVLSSSYCLHQFRKGRFIVNLTKCSTIIKIKATKKRKNHLVLISFVVGLLFAMNTMNKHFFVLGNEKRFELSVRFSSFFLFVKYNHINFGLPSHFVRLLNGKYKRKNDSKVNMCQEMSASMHSIVYLKSHFTNNVIIT